MTPTDSMYLRLIESLEILSADPFRQSEYIEKLGIFPSTDELALEFDDAYRTVKSNLDSIDLSVEFLSKVDSINAILSQMSEAQRDQWTVDSLSKSSWSKIREIAKNALATS